MYIDDKCAKCPSPATHALRFTMNRGASVVQGSILCQHCAEVQARRLNARPQIVRFGF